MSDHAPLRADAGAADAPRRLFDRTADPRFAAASVSVVTAVAGTLLLAALAGMAPGHALSAHSAQWQPWTWTFEKIADLKSQETIDIMGIDSDGRGNAHVVGSKWGTPGRSWWYATNASGSWVSNDDLLPLSSNIPAWAALDVTADGVPRLLSGSQWVADNGNQQFEVNEWAFDASARSDPWKATSVLKQTTNFVGFMQGFEGYIAVGDGAGAERSGSVGYWGTCIALETKNGRWTNRSLVKGAVWLNKAFVVDAEQRPHLLCGTKYYHRAGDSWQDEVVTGLKDTQEAYLALDPQGQPAIFAFADPLSMALTVTIYRRSDQGWTSTQTALPSHDAYRLLSFRITASGEPEAVLASAPGNVQTATPYPNHEAAPFHLAVYDGAAWHAQDIDVFHTAGFESGYDATSLSNRSFLLTVPDAGGVRHAALVARKCTGSGICTSPKVYYARIDDHGGAAPTDAPPPTVAPATDTVEPPTATTEPTGTPPPPPSPTATAVATTPPPPSATPVAPPPAKLYLPALRRGQAPDAMGSLQTWTRPR